MNPTVRNATRADAERIALLVNRAFAVERFFKDGDRIDVEQVNALLGRGIFSLLSDAPEKLIACVYVEIRAERGYIGLLSVDPARQHEGIGGRLLQHAELACRAAGCTVVDLRIIDLRTELLAYYGKRGYVERGTESADVVKGAKVPVRFVLMSKVLE